MRVALFLKDETLKALNIESMRILIFTIDNEIIAGIEDYKLYNKDLNYISLWLLNKQVNTVYMREADEDTVKFFRRMDISVKTHEDIKNDSFLKAFLI